MLARTVNWPSAILACLLISGFGESATCAAEQPTACISIAFPTASPANIDSRVAIPLFRSIASHVNGIEQVETRSVAGRCTVVVRLDGKAEPARAMTELSEAIAAVAPQLPVGVEPPVIVPGDPDALAAVWFAVRDKDRPLAELTAISRLQLRPRLSAVAGVAGVRAVGGATRQLVLRLDADRLAARGLTRGDVTSAVREQIAEPGGDRPPALRIEPERPGADALGDVVVRTTPEGNVVRVRDIGAVELAARPEGFASIDGEPAVLVAVTPRPDTKLAVDELRKAAAEVAAALPPGVTIELACDLTAAKLGRVYAVDCRLPDASAQERVQATAAKIVNQLRTMPEHQHVLAWAGSDEPAVFHLRVQDDPKTRATDDDLRKSLADIADVRARVCEIGRPGGDPAPLIHFPARISLAGPDPAIVSKWAGAAAARLRAGKSAAIDVDIAPGPDVLRLQVEVDSKKAAELGVNVLDVTLGLPGAAATITLPGGAILSVSAGDAANAAPAADPDAWRKARVRNAKGELVPLETIAAIRTVAEPPLIVRINGQRVTILSVAPAAGETTATAVAAMKQAAIAERDVLKLAEAYHLIDAKRE